MATRAQKIKLLEEVWDTLPSAMKNTIENVYGGLNNLEDIELEAFYKRAKDNPTTFWKDWVDEQEELFGKPDEPQGRIGNALDRVAETLGLNPDDLTKREEKELLPTDEDTGRASPEMKKRASPKNELPESVLKYVNNYKKQLVDTQAETIEQMKYGGKKRSDKGPAPKLENYKAGGVPDFEFIDRGRIAKSANVSIDSLEMDLQDDILELEQIIRKKSQLKKWYGEGNRHTKVLTETSLELGERIQTLQKGLADMYFDANMEILKNDVFTKIDDKYYLNDNNRTILIPEETIVELAKRQDNVISDFSLLKSNIVTGIPKKTMELKNISHIPGQELSESDKLLADFNRRIIHSGFIHDPNNATLDEIEMAKHHWKMSGEMAGSGKAVVTSEVASNNLIDMGDMGVIEVQRNPKFEQSGRATELGVVAEIGDRVSLEEQIELFDRRNSHPVFNFSASMQVQMEDFGWFQVDKDGNVKPVDSAKNATNIGEALENLKKNPKGAEIVKFLGLSHYTNKDWLEKNQKKTGLTPDDLMNKRIRSQLPLGTTENNIFGKPLKQGPIVNSFLHQFLDDGSLVHNADVFHWDEEKMTMSLRNIDKLPKGVLQQVGTDYFKTYETLLASGMELPVKRTVNPVGGKASLVPSVRETIFNKYLIQIDFLNKKDFKGMADSAKIGKVIQDLYKNVFEQPDIPLLTSEGYFAEKGIKTRDVVAVLEKDLAQIVEEFEKLETGEIFGEDTKDKFKNQDVDYTWEKHLNEAKAVRMQITTEHRMGSQEAKRRLQFDPTTGFQFYEGVEKQVETKAMKGYMKIAKEIVPELDENISIKATKNIDILIKKGYLFQDLPKSPGEFLERMEIVLPESKVSSDILQDKPSVEKKIEGYGKRIMFSQYKTYMTELSKSPDFVKSTSEFPFRKFPALYEQLVPESKVSISTITTGDLPADMGMHILQSKEIQHGLPTGALSSGDIETGIRTAASLEFLKDLQSTAKLSTSDITKQAIQGDFYDQLKDALKLLVKKG
tara:strand:- start:285 stop:3326 length:3042 start_codon:yes stop_codon:yes gene_type:complete